MKLPKGTRIRFLEERISYTVQASNLRYAVCTKPFRLQNTVLYTIVDFVDQVRGLENLIFPPGYETEMKCEEALERLATGNTIISYRNNIPLKLRTIVFPAEG